MALDVKVVRPRACLMVGYPAVCATAVTGRCPWRAVKLAQGKPECEKEESRDS